jgi:hypothetical protein
MRRCALRQEGGGWVCPRCCHDASTSRWTSTQGVHLLRPHPGRRPLPTPELHEDKDRQRHFKRASECNDALIELWNCLSQRMRREEGKAPTLATRQKKARLLGNKGKIFVLKFVAAYCQSAAKPYTHMVTHLEDMQLAVEVTRASHMVRTGSLTLTCAISCVGRRTGLL